MGNSSITLQSVVDDTKTTGELKPVVMAGGYITPTICNIANDVISVLISKRFNWKWNRFNVTPFYTISWQQDYAIPAVTQTAANSPWSVNSGITNLAWLEHGYIVNINNTSIPKPLYKIEVVRDLEATFYQTGQPGQCCWLPNSQLIYGTWLANAVYTNPLGANTTPSNPASSGSPPVFVGTQVVDTNGNFQVLTVYGTTGSTAPSWPVAGAAAGTKTNDGTCVWTVVDPAGQGFRLNPLPSQNGVVWQVNLVAQKKPIKFTALSQTLDPIPDDYAWTFRQGFRTFCYQRSPDPDVRAKFPVEYKLWVEAMSQAAKQGDREQDSAGFYPSTSLTGANSGRTISPANPYNWPWSS